MIKIECLENKINGKLQYTGYIKYKDLVKYALLKPLTVNRLTNHKRVYKMKEYIEKPESIYPPLVIALEIGCNYSYNNNELLIGGESDDLIAEEDRLVIIDGQHRYLSIKELIDTCEDDEILNRKQAVFILNNMSDLDQRHMFMEINDNMQKVSSVSRRIFEVKIPNYISLRTIINLDIVKKINIKNDQCTEYYPYKFILSGNQLLFKDIELENFNNQTLLDDLEKYIECSECIWDNVLKFIEKNSVLNIGISKNANLNDYKSIKTEIFIKVLFGKIIKENPDILTLSKEEIKSIITSILSNIENNDYFSHEDELIKLDKKEKEKEILRYIEGNDE